MSNLVRLMAQNSFGYGSWDAPFWFIGPEQGGSGNEKRARAFAELGHDGLCDCEAFHDAIGETRWHRKPTERARFNQTWRRLMMLLMPAIKRDTDDLSLRDYQSRYLGKSSGETCVIELCGLSAKNFKEKIDRRSFLDNRIEQIKRKLEERMGKTNPPLKLVVIYGSKSRQSWKRITGFDFKTGSIERLGTANLAFINSPTAFGQRDADWIEFGVEIAKHL